MPATASFLLSLFPLSFPMSSPAPESSSNRDASGFRLGGSEKLRKPRWKLDDLPDLTGKVVMITNPNNKVGKDTAKVLALCLAPMTSLMMCVHRLSCAKMRPFTLLPLISRRPSTPSPS